MKKNSEKGSALIWALVLLIVVSYAAMTILDIQRADIKEITRFKEHNSSYYLALGGLELGLGALLTHLSSYPGDTSYHGGLTLFDYYANRYSVASHEVLSHEFPYMDGTRQVGKADVSIYMATYYKMDWVVVESTGRRVIGQDAAGNPVFEPEAVTLYMRINKKNVKDIYRDGKSLPPLTTTP